MPLIPKMECIPINMPIKLGRALYHFSSKHLLTFSTHKQRVKPLFKCSDFEI